MVMRKIQPRRTLNSNAFLLWLGVGIFVIGGAFIYFYGTLRASNLAPIAPGQTPSAVSETNMPSATAAALRELGIDPEASNLSPAAQSAIVRAHEAALSAGRAEAANEPAGTNAAPSGEQMDEAPPPVANPPAPGPGGSPAGDDIPDL